MYINNQSVTADIITYIILTGETYALYNNVFCTFHKASHVDSPSCSLLTNTWRSDHRFQNWFLWVSAPFHTPPICSDPGNARGRKPVHICTAAAGSLFGCSFSSGSVLRGKGTPYLMWYRWIFFMYKSMILIGSN